jgi:SAM-dependent methyltransferase
MVDSPSAISRRTLGHYESHADAFWEGTRDHDVTQNYAAFLGSLDGPPPLTLLDFGCGPGRDLDYFRSVGHRAVGLDGCAAFSRMARERTGCEVLEQDFLNLHLPEGRFDGIFANASLFHVPSRELLRVLGQLHRALKPRGVVFASNPRPPPGQGPPDSPHREPDAGREGWNGDRYGCYFEMDRWREFFIPAGFEELRHYYRPDGLPRSEQPWLAMVWLRGVAPGRGSGVSLRRE